MTSSNHQILLTNFPLDKQRLIILFRLKEYMKKKENNKLVINQTQQKYAKSLQKVRILNED